MASLNTNAAAITALRTLQNTNTQLDKTQNRISTGYKIGEAKDNAAYWSISTTLKSDNKSLGTVKEALSLGSSTVDVMYQALNKAREVLDSIKSKITTATGDNADKKALQGEISQLQKQLVAIASSANFSGQNWLSVDSSATGYDAMKSVVSSFNRSASGAVTLDSIAIDTSSLKLVDANATKEGVLDGGKLGNTSKGGLADMNTAASGTAAVAGSKAGTVNFAYTGTAAATDYLNISYKIDGAASASVVSVKLNDLDSVANRPTLAQIVQAMNNDATFKTKALASIDTSGGGSKLVITSKTAGTGSTVEITNAGIGNSATTYTGGGNTLAANIMPDNTASTNGATGSATSFAGFGGAAIKIDADDMITFKLAVDGGVAKTVMINAATLAAAGINDGEISDAGEYVTVLKQALTTAGFNTTTQVEVTASANTTAGIVKIATRNTDATKAALQVTGSDASKGLSILTLDVTRADSAMLTQYLNAVSTAFDKVTSSAATLGAITARVDLQKSFVDTLMDTIDKGVSSLIDADMSEESTRLQALQVKQQLGVQALSIANQSSQSILSLFQSNR